MKRETVELTNNNHTPYKKSLCHPVFGIISERGSIGEIELFSFFPNRRLAIEAVRRWTNGKFAVLHHEISGGERRYYFSEYHLQKNRIPQEVPA
jgi:hypothetical protein